MKPPTLLAVSLLSVPLAAQTMTIPASYTSSPAPSSTSYPWGYSTAMRTQILFAASETGRNAAIVLTSLQLRGNPTATNAAKSGIDVQISISTSPLVRATMTNTFASNHGQDLTVVYNRKMTSVNSTAPSFYGQGSGKLPFDKPFVYDPTKGSILVDFDLASSTTGAWSIESAASSPSNARKTTFGTGCNGMNLSSTGGGNTYVLTYNLSGGPASMPGFFLLGTVSLPAPIPLPFSSGCNLYQDILLLLSFALNTSGGYSLPLSYQANPALRGVTVYGQMLAFDTTKSQFSSSQSVAATLTDAHDGGRCYSLGTNTATTGTLQLGSMIVIEFL